MKVKYEFDIFYKNLKILFFIIIIFHTNSFIGAQFTLLLDGISAKMI